MFEKSNNSFLKTNSSRPVKNGGNKEAFTGFPFGKLGFFKR